MTHPCLAAVCASICLRVCLRLCFLLLIFGASPAQVDFFRDHVVLSLESGQRSYSQGKVKFEI